MSSLDETLKSLEASRTRAGRTRDALRAAAATRSARVGTEPLEPVAPAAHPEAAAAAPVETYLREVIGNVAEGLEEVSYGGAMPSREDFRQLAQELRRALRWSGR